MEFFRGEKLKILKRDAEYILEEDGTNELGIVDHGEERQEYGVWPLAKDVLKVLNEFVDKYPDARIQTDNYCELWITTEKEGPCKYHEIGIVTSEFYD